MVGWWVAGGCPRGGLGGAGVAAVLLCGGGCLFGWGLGWWWLVVLCCRAVNYSLLGAVDVCAQVLRSSIFASPLCRTTPVNDGDMGAIPLCLGSNQTHLEPVRRRVTVIAQQTASATIDDDERIHVAIGVVVGGG